MAVLALLVPMLLSNGGYGYENRFWLFSALPLQHRLDRVFDLLGNASRATTIDNRPPYDIARNGEDDYRITMAVAGFGQDELSIVQEQPGFGCSRS